MRSCVKLMVRGDMNHSVFAIKRACTHSAASPEWFLLSPILLNLLTRMRSFLTRPCYIVSLRCVGLRFMLQGLSGQF